MSKAATVYLLQEEDTDLFETPNDFLTSPALAIGFRVAILCFVVLWLALAVLDLRRRRAPGDGAVLLGGRSPARAIFGNFDLPHCPPAGVPTRLPGTRAGGRCAREEAQAAGQPVSQVSVDCGEGVPTLPECGWDLKKPCENCQKPLHLAWNTCPYCATVQSEKNVNW